MHFASNTMKCARCNRQLKKPAPTGYGPVCATAVLGVQPGKSRTERAQHKDVRQVELFEARP